MTDNTNPDTGSDSPRPTPDTGPAGELEPTNDEIFGLINIVTDLQDVDALDKAYPEVFSRLVEYGKRITALQSRTYADGVEDAAKVAEGWLIPSDWTTDAWGGAASAKKAVVSRIRALKDKSDG